MKYDDGLEMHNDICPKQAFRILGRLWYITYQRNKKNLRDGYYDSISKKYFVYIYIGRNISKCVTLSHHIFDRILQYSYLIHLLALVYF